MDTENAKGMKTGLMTRTRICGKMGLEELA